MFKILLTILAFWVIYQFVKAILVLFQIKNTQNINERKASKRAGETTIKYIPKNKIQTKGKKSNKEYTDYEEIE
ncbi:MAG: hypothetical protein ISR55_12570 [Bacteroidetes bacterium]|nr:hypothetical protein [Bacteroidota bacterium]MBL6964651.1 hypothetical protein [Bacteroidota bacterium]